MKKLLLLSILSISLFAASGQELFESKCMSCHGVKVPTTKAEKRALVAPPIGNVLFHLDAKFNTAMEIKNHIVQFTLNPSKERAICNSVKRFGVMPSQKGNVTEAELNKIADFLNNVIAYSKNGHSSKGSKKGCKGGSCSSKQGGCKGGSCGSKQ